MDANINYWTIGSVVIGFLLVLPSIMGLFSKNKFDVNGKVCIGHPVVHQPRLTTPKTVLLTGASEGMGLSVAKQLAQKGASIIIVARNVGRLEEALGQIKVSFLPQHQTMLTCPSRRRQLLPRNGSNISVPTSLNLMAQPESSQKQLHGMKAEPQMSYGASQALPIPASSSTLLSRTCGNRWM